MSHLILLVFTWWRIRIRSSQFHKGLTLIILLFFIKAHWGPKDSRGYIVSWNQNKWFCLCIFSPCLASLSLSCPCISVCINTSQRSTQWPSMDGCQWSEQIRMTKLYTKPRHHQASHLPVCHTDALNHHRLIVCVPMHVCVRVIDALCLPSTLLPLPLVPPQSELSRKHEALGDSGVLSQPVLGPLCLFFSSLCQSPTAVGKAEMRP